MPPAGGNLSAALPKGRSEHFDNVVGRSFPWPLSGLSKLSDPIFLDLWQDCRRSTVRETGFGIVARPDFVFRKSSVKFDNVVKPYPRSAVCGSGFGSTINPLVVQVDF